MSQMVELPDAVYQALLKEAKASGTSPADWIAKKLPKPPRIVTDEEREAAYVRLRECQVSLGYATGIDNEQIDADLAREYGDDHADLYQPKKEA